MFSNKIEVHLEIVTISKHDLIQAWHVLEDSHAASIITHSLYKVQEDRAACSRSKRLRKMPHHSMSIQMQIDAMHQGCWEKKIAHSFRAANIECVMQDISPTTTKGGRLAQHKLIELRPHTPHFR
jgi:hypothetical protein